MAKRKPYRDAAEIERQRCLRCVDLMRETIKSDDGFLEMCLIRLRNQIASGEEPLTFEQQLQPDREPDLRDN
jgi:hypothetical protein